MTHLIDISFFLSGDRVPAAPCRRPPLKTGHRGQTSRSSLHFHLHAPKLHRVPMQIPKHRELHLAASMSVSTIGHRHAGENAPPPIALSPWWVPTCTTSRHWATVPHRCCRRHSDHILFAGQPELVAPPPRPGWAGQAILASGPSRRHVALGRIAAQDCAVVFFFIFVLSK
jgi:hypothetical protein